MPKISVIVPVFNVEKYVERAIVSLMEQTIDDVEFIIIDDGSTDNSLSVVNKIISNYPKRKKQVILFSRENRGVAATRNEGLSLAKGDYIIHLDSDDWVDIDWLNIMYTKALQDQADVVICSYREVYNRKNIIINQKSASTGIECVKKLIVGDINNANWNKLVKRSVYKKNNIKYMNDINIGEDLLVSLSVFIYSNRISCVNKALYNYNMVNDNSLTKNLDNKAIGDLSKVANKVLELIAEEINVDDEFDKCIDIFKNGIRNTFVLNSIGNLNVKKKALILYQESNYLVEQGEAPKGLTYIYYLNKMKLNSLWFVVDLQLKFQRKIRSFS